MIAHATVTSGLGRASERMIAKMRDGVFEPLAFTPYPGSLNLAMLPGYRTQIARWPNYIEDTRGRRYWPARVRPGIDHHMESRDGVRCYVILFQDHAELIAPAHLRSVFGLTDDDYVTIRLEDPA